MKRCPNCSKKKPPEEFPRNKNTYESGEVRGVLCFGCNGGLGQFNDNPEWLPVPSFTLAAATA
jgi:hypothetical protein